jgi:hypothetical protein
MRPPQIGTTMASSKTIIPADTRENLLGGGVLRGGHTLRPKADPGGAF